MCFLLIFRFSVFSFWLHADRERVKLEAKYREQLEGLNLRGTDLDTENRQLRALKYELDTKVIACPALSAVCLPELLHWCSSCRSPQA